ncbi:HIRAN domain-containing protein [Hugenholtzia roseola]|uniref:HIRAN domain-containing protein n=1 Tax=Hugenholtzia roseola TaxID=1002 RepID=UPI0003F7AF8E|nr:HIRAN domain-containing protein [Hugenholtzia roseola]
MTFGFLIFFILIVGVIGLMLLLFLLFSQNKTRQKEQERYKLYLDQFDPAKNTKALKPIQTKVMGVRYANPDGSERQKIIAKCKKGDKLLLLPDPLNRYDKDAIKITTLRDEIIGYLDADLALEVRRRLEEGLLVKASICQIYKNKEGLLQVEVELVKYSKKA